MVSTSGFVIGGEYFVYTAADRTGGIVGVNEDSRINNCTNHASVSGNGLIGGLVGINYGIIHTSLNTGSISGYTGSTGGLAAQNINANDSHIYSCCTNRGTVNGQAANANNQIGSGKAVETCRNGHTKR
jgi:putative lipase involved disintegration of autophagic bodies